MAKNKNRVGSQTHQTQNSTPSGAASNDKAHLEKLIPNWTAAFKDASKVYKDAGDTLDIAIDETQIKTVVGYIRGEDAKAVSGWIVKFAQVCRDLSKYQAKLDEEFKTRWDACNQRGQQLEKKEAELVGREAELASESERLSKQSHELTEKEHLLIKGQGELTTRERDISTRERNAETGFEKQNREALEQLHASQTKEITKYHEVISQLSQKKSDLAREIEHARIVLTETELHRQSALTEREIALAKWESELNGTAKQHEMVQLRFDHKQKATEDELSKKSQYLEREWDDLVSARDNLDKLVGERMDDERKQHQKILERGEQQRVKIWEKVDALQAKLDNFRELESLLGDRSIDEFMQQWEALKEENRKNLAKLAETDAAELERLNESLRSQVDSLEKELKKLRPELDLARTETAQKRVAAIQLHAIEREKRVLEQHSNVLKVNIDELESRIEQLTDAHKTQTPFPAMSGMDTSKDFQASMELEDIADLKTFATELQHRIAQAEKTVELYYPLEDVRVLLGGLAMSQLHVFQGISGTGKTSLAKAFAKAMGGFCTDIAVQAGWRDRDDLLGHYNAFERRYYEKDCLQALYQAQTPRWSDTCNVILLDEMNLSRPEQYFAEFLSALEKNAHGERLISLSETALPNAPKGLKDGRQILVPGNVWFIGTANHDETTNELADKTYDRAHVMTLPKQDERFEIKKFDKASYSCGSLQSAFRKAAQDYASDVQILLRKLTGHGITTQLANTFELGWGNRFERQAKSFIPVMLACGATAGEALDHLLSTRVMRSGKVTGRYDVTADDIGKLTDSLMDFWKKGGLSDDPSKSLALLNMDRQRKERGG